MTPSFPEEKVWDLINDGWDRMSGDQRRLWETMKILPVAWMLRGYEPCWVVAIIGQMVIYHNPHEHGFERSAWREFGVIETYGACGWDLHDAVQVIIDLIRTGVDIGPWSSPPIAGTFESRG